MKHTTRVTAILILIFIITQLFGLATVANYIQVNKNVETGEIIIDHPDTVMGEPLQVENKSYSFLYILGGVIIGTAILLLFIKFKVGKAWKYWFLFAVIIAISISLGVYINAYLAYALAIILGIIKIYRPNVYIHNLTEILVYTGITLIFISALNLISVIILLFAISIYDMYAVWKSKHMITMAKFQTESKVFAGLMIPYSLKKDETEKSSKKLKRKIESVGKVKKEEREKGKKEKVKNAILGGGDVAFPLLFSATILEWLITDFNMEKGIALLYTLIPVITTTIALTLLLVKSKKNKFYPAMPFISAGCFIGLGLVWLLI